MEQIHPCFYREAHGRYGRIHLPVAPRCNIQCVYCKREYDCPNESRPGVCSRVETPQEACERAAELLLRYPENQVIGIAGPGEPLANEETFHTFEKIRSAGLKADLCLSTNGLYLPESLSCLKSLGVTYLTVTINTLDETIGARIYPYVCDHGNHLRGIPGAALLLDRQQEGIRKAVEKGFFVKVNMVLMEGCNERDVLPLAQKLSEWKVSAMNINSVIRATDDPSVRSVSEGRLKEYRRLAGGVIRQINFCRQCRADAYGIPGKGEAGHDKRTGD